MNARILTLVLAGAAAVALATSCGPVTPEGSPTPTPTPFDLGGRACPDGSVYTYENFGEPFLRSQCLGCHSSDLPEGSRQNAPVGVDFNTYQEVRGWAVRIYVRAGDTNVTMPPAGGPVAADRVALGDWIACNAPREVWASDTP